MSNNNDPRVNFAALTEEQLDAWAPSTVARPRTPLEISSREQLEHRIRELEMGHIQSETQLNMSRLQSEAHRRMIADRELTMQETRAAELRPGRMTITDEAAEIFRTSGLTTTTTDDAADAVTWATTHPTNDIHRATPLGSGVWVDSGAVIKSYKACGQWIEDNVLNITRDLQLNC